MGASFYYLSKLAQRSQGAAHSHPAGKQQAVPGSPMALMVSFSCQLGRIWDHLEGERSQRRTPKSGCPAGVPTTHLPLSTSVLRARKSMHHMCVPGVSEEGVRCSGTEGKEDSVQWSRHACGLLAPAPTAVTSYSNNCATTDHNKPLLA